MHMTTTLILSAALALFGRGGGVEIAAHRSFFSGAAEKKLCRTTVFGPMACGRSVTVPAANAEAHSFMNEAIIDTEDDGTKLSGDGAGNEGGGAAVRTVTGRVTEAGTGEELIGATVRLVSPQGERPTGAVTGLDGTFSIVVPVGSETVLRCECLGYAPQTVRVSAAARTLLVTLKVEERRIAEIVVTGENHGRTEAAARAMERSAAAVLNVVSSRTLQLAPDITVGGTLQRMSGVNMERNASGEGRYALLRGMDKRYNFALINGVKIPSPDNKNRFVPLDLFPSDILDRVEVHKSLTADMEGDGIGGAVNLQIKSAPDEPLLAAHVATGYDALYFSRPATAFAHSAIARRSPYERMGRPADYRVTAADFSNRSFRTTQRTPLPDLVAGLTVGRRWADGRLGVLLCASYQNVQRGKDGHLFYRPGKSQWGAEKRQFSERDSRLGLHTKVDYRLSSAHSLALYGGYADMTEAQVRECENGAGGSIRLRWQRQQMADVTLSGRHDIVGSLLRIDWRAVYAYARNAVPDQAEFSLVGDHIASASAATRRWEHNDDASWAVYADGTYDMLSELTLKMGGMVSGRHRKSFFNEFTLDSATPLGSPQVYGRDWQTPADLLLTPRPYGNIGDPLNYRSTECIAAPYITARYHRGSVEAQAGLRGEHTRQTYTLAFPRDTDPRGRQSYWDWLPSASLKWEVAKNRLVRLTYYRAVGRPSFFEIVPYSVINEDYKERGNPSLRHTTADNLDVRFELYHRSSEQLLVGAFYKRIADPIEQGLITEGQDLYLKPMNFGTAHNVGIEIDATKYFRWFGIRANYTYTHSSITTSRQAMDGNDVRLTRQSRPLAGQAAHVANLALLVKDGSRHIDAQLAFGLMGRRLASVSNWADNDIYDNTRTTLDLSFEKGLGRHLALFGKATNLLNTPLTRYVTRGPQTANADKALPRCHGGVVERRERYGQTFLVGLRVTR